MYVCMYIHKYVY